MFPADGMNSVVFGDFVLTRRNALQLFLPQSSQRARLSRPKPSQHTTGQFLPIQQTESTSVPTTQGEWGIEED